MNLTKIEIDTGLGYVEFKPNFYNFSLTKQRFNNVRVRFSAAGDLMFSNTEFETLNNLRLSGTITLDIKIYINYSLCCLGKLNLMSKNWNIENKVCNLAVDIVDKYTEILKTYDTEQNMFAEAIPESAKIRILSSLHQIALPTTSDNWATQIANYNPDGTQPVAPSAANDWTYHTPPYSTLTNAAITSITDAGSGRLLITSAAHGLIDSQYNLPDLTIYNTTNYNAVYNDVIVIDADTFTVSGTFVINETGDWKVAEAGFHVFTFKCQYVTFPATGYDLGHYFDNWYLKTGITKSNAELEFSTWKVLYDIIEDLLSYSDSSINISQIAGVNDYCKYFDVTDTDYNKLMIEFIYNLKDVSHKKRVAQFTLKRLLEIYKILFNLDWRINDNNYFQFIHPSESVQSLPSFAVLPKHNFTARSKALGVDFLQYEIKNFVNSETWNLQKTDTIFFDGYPIIYDNESEQNKKYEVKEICSDLRKVVLNTDDIKDDGFVIIATFLDAAENIIYNVDENINGKLAVSDLQDNVLSSGDRPFVSGKINNIDKVFINVANNRFMEMSRPLNDFSDLDFDYLVKTEITDKENETGARIESVTQKFDNSFAKIKLSF